MEKRYLHKDGHVVWGDMCTTTVHDAGGRLLYFVTHVLDITARKQAEEALRESEARYHSLFTSMHEGFILAEVVTDEDGKPIDYRFLDLNPAAERYFGCPHAEIVGSTYRTLGGEQVDVEWIATLTTVALTGEPVTLERYAPVGGQWVSLKAYSPRAGQFAAVFADISARKQMEEAQLASLHEKEVLLKEIHHRVKNNMQVISSLVSLQADTIDDPVLRALFNDLRDQVRTMALVHEKLYQSESLANIDFAEYTQSLLSYLWRAYGDAAMAVRLTLDVQPVTISIEQAVPCGLLLNELVTNALKHAFRDRADGELTVALHAAPDETVCLSVRDNGVGLPADWQHSPSLGLQLVQMLTRQVRGTLDVRTESGTAFALTFTPSTPPPHREG